MDDDRRRALESRLQTLLGELADVCSELGIDARPADSEGGRGRPRGRVFTDAGPLLLASVDHLLVGFVAREVLEIVRMVALADAVEPRPALAGFVNLRGDAVPVLDLRTLLDLPTVDIHPDQALVVLQAERGRIAVIVDEVLDIYEFGPENFRDRSELELRRGFIDGVARIDDELVAVIHPGLLARAAL